MIEVYADGAYNPGLDQGGWAAVVVKDHKKQAFTGEAKGTTSNRMELTAALEGIRRTPQGAEVVVYTDSQYLFGTMTKGWQRRVNRDLWEKLDESLALRKVRWELVQGDAQNPFHKEAHALATNLASHPIKPPTQQKQQLKAPAQMVDISPKPVTLREATAKAVVKMEPATLEQIQKGEIAKGDVLALAQTAGIMAAKQTPQLIPLCHPLLLSHIELSLYPNPATPSVEITSQVRGEGKTGMEMEALTAVAIAALTVYDMCKAVDPAMSIEIKLVRKSGGKSGVVELENP